MQAQETMSADGSARPAGGMLSAFEPPSGPGVRVDGFGYAGYRTSARYDSLLAKLIVHAGAGGLPVAVAKARRALSEFKIAGAPTNIGFLQSLLAHPAVAAGEVHTRFIEETMGELAATPDAPKLYFEAAARGRRQRAGVQIDAVDPLAVLALGKAERVAADPEDDATEGPEGTKPLRAPLEDGHRTQRRGRRGRPRRPGAIHHGSHEDGACGLRRLFRCGAGDHRCSRRHRLRGPSLSLHQEAEVEGGVGEAEEVIDLDHIRPDLAEVLERHRLTLDAARPEAVARRRKTGQRTTRENVEDLCDPGSFTEYGGATIAARRRRNTVEELIATTPADGMVMGLGQVNGDRFSEDRARVAAMATTTPCRPAPRARTTTRSSTG